MARTEFTRKTKDKVSERAQGKCESCGLPLKGGRGDFDHKIPCALGGDNSISNCWLIGTCCHKPKTKKDIQQTRKADRQKSKASGAIKPKSKMAKKPKESRHKNDVFAGLPKRKMFS